MVAGCEVTRVEIWVRDAVDLYGVDVRFTFDPTILRAVDADPVAAGIQITPLASFLKPDFVARKIACNAADPNDPNCSQAGVVRYAATQTTPNKPVSGSGAVAAVDFVAIGPGVSPLNMTFTQLVDVDGLDLANTPVNSQLGAEKPGSPSLSIAWDAPDTATLSWTAVPAAAQYRLFRDTAPYFAPAEPPHHVTAALSFSDAGAVGDPAVNHFYVVTSGCSTGFASDPSNRVGEFDFALLPGQPAPVAP
jgi:hypothetical protein